MRKFFTGCVAFALFAGLASAQAQTIQNPSGWSGSAFNYVGSSATLTVGRVTAVNTTASRALTLPALAGLTQGQWVATLDLDGLAATNNYTVTANGSDLVNGSTPNVVTVAGSQLVRYVVGPGASSWYVNY